MELEVAGLDRLQSELEAAVASDSRYWLQNAAKFRAVAQGVSYEQFEDLVKTSHLAPLGPADKAGQGCGKAGLWNPVASRKDGQHGAAAESEDAPARQDTEGTGAVPRTVRAFQQEWRGREDGARLELLSCLGEQGLRRIFPTEVPPDLLGEMVATLRRAGAGPGLVVGTLRALTLARRFSLCLSFLEPGVRGEVGALLAGLEGPEGSPVRGVRQAFGL
jgi:hypothetical protein